MTTIKEHTTTCDQPPAEPATSVEREIRHYTAALTKNLQTLAALRQAEFQVRSNLQDVLANLDEYLDLYSSAQLVAETCIATRDKFNELLDTTWHVLKFPDAVDGTVCNVSGTISWYAVAGTQQTTLAPTGTAQFCTRDTSSCASCLYHEGCTLSTPQVYAV